MINLANSKLLDILPPNLRNDPDIMAASKAVDIEFSNVVNSIKNVFTIADIKNASSDIVDHIAIESHTDFYDYNLDIEIRRALAEKAIELHMNKGTPSAVEKLIATLFDEGEVVEWYDYNGDPYMFRVITNNELVTTELATEFIRALDSVKNKRSWLEKVIIMQKENMNLFFAGIIHTGDYITVKQVL
ncbi:MAG: P2-related tail formation protein [Clostridium sp.]|jgi:P2-related tail formation protein